MNTQDMFLTLVMLIITDMVLTNKSCSAPNENIMANISKHACEKF